MSNLARTLPALLCALLAVVAVPAPAAVAAAPTSTQQSRLGRGFGRRSPSLGGRTRTRPRSSYPYRARRPFTARRFFGGVLKALGLAYLFNLLFGWGHGGSPFGLLLLAFLVLFAIGRLRRPRRYAHRY